LRIGCSWLLMALPGLIGCRMPATMHVWQPPTIQSGSKLRVALAPLDGRPELSRQIASAMAATDHPGVASVTLIGPEALDTFNQVQLASHSGQTSDLAAMDAARAARADVLLMGQIVQEDLERRHSGSHDHAFAFLMAPESVTRPQRLMIAWKMVSVPDGQVLGRHTVNVDRISAQRQYPDLVLTEPDPATQVVAAAARQSVALYAPRLEKEEVPIALPWVWPGSSLVRQGNIYANRGQWQEAERHWQNAAAKHHTNTAAWHNLGLAAVAKEDFELARRRLERANRWYSPTKSDRSLVWLQQQESHYRQAMGWDRPEPGVIRSAPASSTPADSVPSIDEVTTRKLEDLPWWTAIPMAKEPGWSWWAWMTQPRPW
jgi:hypothetical protein